MIFLKYLEKAAKEAEKEIIETEKITVENAIPIILISQVNHIGTIEEEVKDIRANMATQKDIARLTEIVTGNTKAITSIQETITGMKESIIHLETTIDGIKREIASIKHWQTYSLAVLAVFLSILLWFFKS